MQELRGKVAVITGAASGIGLAVARHAAANGMQLVLADIEEKALDEAAESLKDAGAAVLPVVTDVSEASSVDALRDRSISHFGAVHLVHNNAGVGSGGLIWEVPDGDWRWVLGVNLFGVVNGIRAFVPLLIEQGEGHVVNTASLAGLVSTPLMGPYNASKHAVVTISETLAKDLRAVGAEVGVSVLCPGFVRTRIDESERNRPSWAPASGDPQGREQMQQVIRGLVEAGIGAELVAERVLAAVRSDTFYIFTHDVTDGAVSVRMHDILERRHPSDTPFA